MSFIELSQALWRERQLLELLVFKLETIQALTATGHTRWIARATREMENVSEEMRLNSLALRAESVAVAQGLDLPPETGLRALAEAAPEPWNELLAEHLTALTALASDVQQIAATNAEILTRGRLSAQETALKLGGDEVLTYDPTGRADADHTPLAPQLIDQAL